MKVFDNKVVKAVVFTQEREGSKETSEVFITKSLRISPLTGVSDLENAVTVLEAIVSGIIGTVLMFEWSFVKS
jgi:hypothetical protein